MTDESAVRAKSGDDWIDKNWEVDSQASGIHSDYGSFAVDSFYNRNRQDQN